MRSQGDESHRALVTDAALLLMVQNKALLTHTDLIQVGPCGAMCAGCSSASAVRSGGQEGGKDRLERVSPHRPPWCRGTSWVSWPPSPWSCTLTRSRIPRGWRGRSGEAEGCGVGGCSLPRVGHRPAVRAHPRPSGCDTHCQLPPLMLAFHILRRLASAAHATPAPSRGGGFGRGHVSSATDPAQSQLRDAGPTPQG